MTPRFLSLSLPLAILIVLGRESSTVHAQEAPIPASGQELTPAPPEFCEGDGLCIEYYAKARQLSKSGQIGQAVLAYQAAYDRKPFPPLLFNIARLHHKNGNVRDAIKFYRLYIDTSQGDDAEQRENARKLLDEAILKIPMASEAASPPSASLASPPELPRQSIPVYKRWWLWTTLGIVVAGVAVGATLGAYAHQPNWPGAPELRPFP